MSKWLCVSGAGSPFDRRKKSLKKSKVIADHAVHGKRITEDDHGRKARPEAELISYATFHGSRIRREQFTRSEPISWRRRSHEKAWIRIFPESDFLSRDRRTRVERMRRREFQSLAAWRSLERDGEPRRQPGDAQLVVRERGNLLQHLLRHGAGRHESERDEDIGRDQPEGRHAADQRDDVLLRRDFGKRQR